MKTPFETIQAKIKNWEAAQQSVYSWQNNQETVVFTNGCFDILHYGHIHYLAEASLLGERLVLGLNSKNSITRLKGKNRPINDDETRLHLLAAMSFIDLVVVFEEDTPYNLIQTLQPNILVKGGDWQPKDIVGSDIVLKNGGQVKSLPYIQGYSTTNIEQQIINNYKNSLNTNL